MIGSWLRALARKFLSGGSLRMTSHPARRRRAWLRLEALEDRTLTSTLDLEPPGLLPPAPEAGVVALPSQNIDITTGGLAPTVKDGSLLEDVRALPLPGPHLPGNLATIDPDPGSGQASSSPSSLSGFGATGSRLHPRASLFVRRGRGTERSCSARFLCTRAGGVARPDETTARPSPASEVGITGDAGLGSTSRPARRRTCGPGTLGSPDRPGHGIAAPFPRLSRLAVTAQEPPPTGAPLVWRGWG
jgi:hypothetical protein